MWPVLVCVLVGLAIYIAGTARDSGDYGSPTCTKYRCDDARPALDAAARGDIGGFFRHQPTMGPVSLVVRIPAVALARAADAEELDRYRGGAAVCLALALLIVLWLARAAADQRAPRLGVAAFIAVATVATLWTNTLHFGHPEEPLAAALTLAAAVLAARGRLLAAGIVLGAAVATKEWALLAVGPIALMGGLAHWRRFLLPALVVAAVLFAPMAIASPGTFKKAHVARVDANTTYTSPLGVWWRLGKREVTGHRDGEVIYVVHPPKLAAHLVRPVMPFVALVLSVLWWRRRPSGSPFEPLLLLTLVLLLRDVLDTITYSYHHVPMLMALAGWEVFARRRFPVVAIAVSALLQVTFRLEDFYTLNTVYLAWALPLVAYLAIVSFRRVIPVSAAGQA